MKWYKKKNNGDGGVFLLIGFAFVILALILLICFFMHGTTIISGNYPEDISSNSLYCIMHNIQYPLFRIGESEDSSIEINVLFEGKNMHAISLISTMSYANSKIAKIRLDGHQGDMNTDFGELGPDSLGARYTVNGNNAQMSLYAKRNEIVDRTAKYFLMDSVLDKYEDYKNNYEKQGFTCIEK